MKKLRVALSKIEKGEQLLARLEELKGEGEVEEEQYQQKKEQYAELLESGKKELESIKASFSGKLEALKRDAEKYPAELKDLELKNKLGELDANQFSRQEQRLRSKIDRAQKDLEATATLLAAETADEAGGYIEVRLEKRTLLRRPDWL